MEAAPLMQAAFEADHVDIMMRGDWEDVQVDLGLLPERITERPRLNVLGRLGIKLPAAERPAPAAPPAGAVARARRKEEKRRKAGRASRKRRK